MMPRTGSRAALIIAAVLCIPLMSFSIASELSAELHGVRCLSANDDHALRFAPAGAGLVPLAGWLIWLAMRPTTHFGA